MNLPSITTTITAGASLSSAIDLGGGVLAGIIIPSTWTTASLTFQVSNDGVNYYNLYDEYGSEVTATPAAGTFMRLSAGDYFGVPQIKLRSGTAASAVNQVSTARLILVLRGGR